MNPLATSRQRETESAALRLIEHAQARDARERVRALLLADPAVRSRDGRLGLDRALDQWVLALAMREINADPSHPSLIWNVDNTPRHWFGHTFPGAAVAVDNPDNINREALIDGDGAYEISGRLPANGPASFNLMLETVPEWRGGIGRNVATITHEDIAREPDGSFLVTIDRREVSDRKNHLPSESGPLMLFARDSFSHWDQRPAALEIACIRTSSSKQEASETDRAARFAAHLQPFVAFWLGFKNSFLNAPPPNTLVGPLGRPGGWGYLAGGKFLLDDDEAFVVTTTDGGAIYTGFQVADPWTIAPDPAHRQSSLNISQARPNPDGTFTTVISAHDPGLHNWIDPVGLREGWFLLRWQGLPAEAGPEGLIRDVRKVAFEDLARAVPAEAPAIDLAGRRAQVLARARGRARLTEESAS